MQSSRQARTNKTKRETYNQLVASIYPE